MQTKAIEYFTKHLEDPTIAKVTITGSADFAAISFQTNDGVMGSALFLENELRDPYLLAPQQRHRWIKRMVELDYPHTEIARTLCCSQSLISKVKKEMQ